MRRHENGHVIEFEPIAANEKNFIFKTSSLPYRLKRKLKFLYPKENFTFRIESGSIDSCTVRCASFHAESARVSGDRTLHQQLV